MQSAKDIALIDLAFRNRARVIASAALETEGGIVLVDPGPGSTVGRLREALEAAGIALDDVAGILLTHIHLDHAGAAGCLVRANRKILVWVHVQGAPHIVNPERLVASARRIYGDAFEPLWGEVLSVPLSNIRSLSGGETVSVGGRVFEVLYTPGHASHHVTYIDVATGAAFAGDTAGVRIPNAPLILPVTPPPDIDIEAWEASIRRLIYVRPSSLFLAHFGFVESVEIHLLELSEMLQSWSAAVRNSLEDALDDAARANRFAERVRQLVRDRSDDDAVACYEAAAVPVDSWYGLARYWRKRLAR